MKRKTISKAVATIAVYAVATRFLSFLFKVYLSQKLGAEVVGLYQICLSVFFLSVSFSASGLPAVLSRKIAEDSVLDSGNSDRYLSAATIIGIFTVSAIAVFFCIFRNTFSFVFSDKRAASMFLVMLPALFSTCVYSMVRGWFWGKSDFNSFSLAELVEEIFRILFGFLLIGGFSASISGETAVALSFTLADFACALTIVIMYFVKKGKIRKPIAFKELLKTAAPITAMRTFGSVAATLTAIIVPAVLVKNGASVQEATADYGRVAGLATPLLTAPTTFISSLSIALIPEMAASNVKNDLDALSRRLDGSLVFALFVSSLFCVLYIPFGREITEIVFADGLSGKYLSITAILLYPLSFNQITTSAMNSLGFEKKSFLNYVIGTVSLVLCLVLLPKYIGIYSIAVGSGICFSLTSVLNLTMLNKKTPLFKDCKQSLYAVIFMPVCCALAFLLKFIISLHMPKFFTVLLAGGVPMILYVALSAAFDVIDLSRFKRKKSFCKN